MSSSAPFTANFSDRFLSWPGGQQTYYCSEENPNSGILISHSFPKYLMNISFRPKTKGCNSTFHQLGGGYVLQTAVFTLKLKAVASVLVGKSFLINCLAVPMVTTPTCNDLIIRSAILVSSTNTLVKTQHFTMRLSFSLEPWRLSWRWLRHRSHCPHSNLSPYHSRRILLRQSRAASAA
jgi:hypothetical protein